MLPVQLLRQLILRADEHTPSNLKKRCINRVNLMNKLPASDAEACKLRDEVRALMPPQQDCIMCVAPLYETRDGDADGSDVKILSCLLHVVHTSCHHKWGDATVDRLGLEGINDAWSVRERCPICLDATPLQLVQKKNELACAVCE